jgi:hypothetical protein
MIPAIAAAVSLLCAAAHAQLDIPGPMHLAHLRGVYVNAKGAPIQGADVTLARDDKVIYSTKTDAAGRFAFKRVSGHFWLHIDMKGHSPVKREIIVGVEALTYLHSSTLYVIAGPGACSDDCSSVFTNREKFNEAIRRNTGHHD